MKFGIQLLSESSDAIFNENIVIVHRGKIFDRITG